MSKARYSTPGPWYQIDRAVIRDCGRELVVATIEAGDLVDTRTGVSYEDGARKVRSHIQQIPGKTFRGESAWSDARRYADDIAQAARREMIDTRQVSLRKNAPKWKG